MSSASSLPPFKALLLPRRCPPRKKQNSPLSWASCRRWGHKAGFAVKIDVFSLLQTFFRKGKRWSRWEVGSGSPLRVREGGDGDCRVQQGTTACKTPWVSPATSSAWWGPESHQNRSARDAERGVPSSGMSLSFSRMDLS